MKVIQSRVLKLTLLSLVVFFNTSLSSADELVFQAEFFSDYPSYPNRNNIQRGTAYTYKKNTDTSSRRKFSSLASQGIKNALVAQNTANPFKAAYPYIYAAGNRRKLTNCPALSYPFNLDNNSATQEWLITSSVYLCLQARGFGSDNIPHMWVLQKKNGRFRILMEGDGYFKVIGSSHSNYDDILAYIYLSRTRANPSSNCGGLMNIWTYARGKYEIANVNYHSDDCDFRGATGTRWHEWNRRYINDAKSESQRIMLLFR